MTKWEYTIYEALSVEDRDSADDQVGELNRLGAEGWEVAAWIQRPSPKGLWGWFLLKRAIP